MLFLRGPDGHSHVVRKLRPGGERQSSRDEMIDRIFAAENVHSRLNRYGPRPTPQVVDWGQTFPAWCRGLASVSPNE